MRGTSREEYCRSGIQTGCLSLTCGGSTSPSKFPPGAMGTRLLPSCVLRRNFPVTVWFRRLNDLHTVRPMGLVYRRSFGLQRYHPAFMKRVSHHPTMLLDLETLRFLSLPHDHDLYNPLLPHRRFSRDATFLSSCHWLHNLGGGPDCFCTATFLQL